MHINPNARVWVDQAAGIFPVLYIDDFYTDPIAVREFALSLDIQAMRALYPGRHAFLAEMMEQRPEIRPFVEECTSRVRDLITHMSKLHIPHGELLTDFSLISTPARNLVKGQKHPHIDGTPVLAIVYLNEEDLGGTSFYKNIPLDMTVARTDAEKSALGEFSQNAPEGPTLAGYDMIFKDLWEKIYTIPQKFNRFVCYPGNVPHWVECRRVPEPFDKRLARLTQRFIVQQMVRPEQVRPGQPSNIGGPPTGTNALLGRRG